MNAFTKHLSSKRVDSALSVTERLLNTTKDAVSGIGPPGIPAVVGVLVDIVHKVQVARSNHETINSLCEDIRHLVEDIEIVFEVAHDRILQRPETLRQRMVDSLATSPLSSRIAQLKSDLDEVSSAATQLTTGSWFRKWWKSASHESILISLREKVANSYTRFHVQSEATVEALVHQGMDDIQKILESEDERTIESLPHADASFRSTEHESKSHFLEGTRTDVLKYIADWEDDRPLIQKAVCVLSGGAGTGKSTIVSEVCRRLKESSNKGKNDKEGYRLGASFFFSRGIHHAHSTKSFFSTIAYQLAQSRADLRPHVIEAIQRYLKDGTSQQMQYMVGELLRKPLRAIPTTELRDPIFIVIDALDECADDTELVGALLRHLLSLVQETPCIRLLLTTRPGQRHIDDVLKDTAFNSIISSVSLDDISRPSVNNDIYQFIRFKLFENPTAKAWCEGRSDVLETLTEKSQGLFIYANTAVHFLLHNPDSLDELLNALIMGDPMTLEPLDQLYLTVLNGAFSLDIKVPKLREDIAFMLGCIAVLQARDGISLRTLETLTGVSMPIARSTRVLRKLRAVVYSNPDNTDAKFRSIHVTFRDFLADRARCCVNEYLVDSKQMHARLAIYCLESLKGTYFKPSDDGVGEMAVQLEDHGHPSHVQYAREHWDAHLVQAGPTEALVGLVKRLATGKDWTTWIGSMGADTSSRASMVKLASVLEWVLYNIDRTTAELLGNRYASQNDGLRVEFKGPRTVVVYRSS